MSKRPPKSYGTLMVPTGLAELHLAKASGRNLKTLSGMPLLSKEVVQEFSVEPGEHMGFKFLATFGPRAVRAFKLLELARINRASEFDVFQKIRLPNSIPYLFAGIKVAIVLSVTGAIVAEFVAANEGLGYLVLQANYNLDTAFALVIAGASWTVRVKDWLAFDPPPLLAVMVIGTLLMISVAVAVPNEVLVGSTIVATTL